MARKNILNRAVETPAEEQPSEPLVTVKALGWIGENGQTYKPGDTFKVAADRADALGKQVEVLS